jgi:16S rRNA (cytosine967-C5)-methyltransferase
LSAPTPARRVAYETLRRVFEEGAWADRALRSAAGRLHLEGRERAQAQALAYGAVQRRGTTDHFAAGLANRQVDRIDAPLAAAIRLGLYEILFADGAADHAAVDQAVSLAKGRGGNRRGSGMVNAVLRRAIRERPALLASLDDSDPAGAAIAHSVPEWLAELWWEQLGSESARSLLAAINRPPERALRVNPLRGDRDSALEALRAAGVETSPPDRPPAPRDSMVVTGGERGGVEGLIGDGILVPQSRASALVVEVLDPQPGERVLDLCAGPGIKAGQIAAALGSGGAGLVAVERDPGRARELEEMLRNLGAPEAIVETADAADPRPGGEQPFDAVLVDPPCSGLGTLASRPDSRWRRSPEEIETTAALAGRILARASEAVAPGGRIVYSTCTISRSENEDVVAGSGLRPEDLTADPGLAGLAASTGSPYLQTRTDRDRTDGFFIARLRSEP